MMVTPRRSNLKKILAANILRLRRQRNCSQEKLAEICGYHRTYIGSIERGERNVTLSTVEALAHALGVSVTALLARHGDGNANARDEDTPNGPNSRK
jgi:transcriptional regulator with XRE-family HTH domain